MKPVHDYGSADQSCSCTSCSYKSESDRTSLKRFVARGSRIDKLYYGKYLPLRERKLLERLIRTRAVYDDLRKQIISDSSVSEPVLKERTRIFSRDKLLDGKRKSNDIIGLVDLVDKGVAFPSEKLSECCSCCICGSNISMVKLPKRRLPIREHKLSHERRHEYDRALSRTKIRMSKVMVASKHKLNQTSEFSKNVRFRTKRVRSEPCICTYKFSGMAKQASSVMKRLHQVNPELDVKQNSDAKQYKSKLNDVENATKQSFKNRKKPHTCLCNKIDGSIKKSTKKIKKIGSELKAGVKKSLEEVAQIIYKPTDKLEPTQRKRKSLVSGDVKEIERNVFTIKKDSLTKFKEELRRKRDRKYWKCKFKCYPDECDPEQCFKISKRKNKRNIRDHRFLEFNKTNKKIDEPWTNPDISVKSDNIENVTKLVRKKQESENTEASNKTTAFGASSVNVGIKKKANTNKENLKSEIDKIEYFNPVTKNLSQMRSKLTRRSVSSSDITGKVISEENINMNVTTPQHSLKNRRRDVELAKEEVAKGMNRQVVRVGSSFSFNVEFYKDKPLQKLPNVNLNEVITQKTKFKIPSKKKHNTINKKEEYQKSKRTHHRNKISGTPHKHNMMKNTQMEKHPLKRCFCTLQLNAKKTKMYVNRLHKQESVQTNKLHLDYPILLPYECNPGICVSSNLNPIVCNKLIKKRNIKHRYISTNTDLETKDVAARTKSKSILSNIPSNIQVHAIRKPESIMLSLSPADVNVKVNHKRPKQAVRIGSTFSFNIEFSKNHSSRTHSDINVNHFTTSKNKSNENQQREKKLGKAKRYIRHKYSQISHSTGKSRHTITKYSLKRCFCTMKFARPEKNKITSISKSTFMSSRSLDQVPKLYPAFKTASVSTRKITKNYNHIKLRQLQYECEPDMCIPGECDPFKCQQILYVKQPKHVKVHSRKLNTENRTRSAYSLTSNLKIIPRTKKVQSTFFANKRKPSNYGLKKTVTTSPLGNQLQPNDGCVRQAVKIGSNFSFNIEFFKEQPYDHQVAPVVNISQKPKSIQLQKKAVLNNHELKEIKPKRKSTQMGVEKKQTSIQRGTLAMERCFCTLKFYKKSKNTRNNKVVHIGTKTPHFTGTSQSLVPTVPHSTMTKNNYKYIRSLDQFECEPHVCIPGKCNPYDCLEPIKRRDRIRYSKEMRVVTKPTNLRSISSSTQKNIPPAKNVFIQSNVVHQQRSTKKQKKLSSLLNFSNKLRHINKEKERQGLKIGSKFSFDIEFSKDRSQIKKVNQRQGITLLKKCFCTLKLRNERENNQNNYRVALPLNQTIKPLKVYTVGRITTGINKYIPQPTSKAEDTKEFKVKNHIQNLNSRNDMIRIFHFKPQQNTDLPKIKYSTSCSTVSPNFIESKYSILSLKRMLYHNAIKESFQLNYALMEQSAKFNKPSSIFKDNAITIGPSIKDEKYHKYRLKKVTSNVHTLKHSSDLNHMNPFSKKNICAMNMQIRDSTKKHITNKLKPYECIPGICKPYDCEPIKCQEFINKRLLKPVYRISDTQSKTKSIQSLPSQTTELASKAQNPQTSKAKDSIKKKSPDLKHKTVTKNRQAVRIGSNFNFNIEFSRSKSDGQKLQFKPSKNNHKSHEKLNGIRYEIQQQVGQRKSKQIGIQYSTRNKKLQSEYMKTEHKASNAATLLKRCFCTPKLKKREEKSIISTGSQTVIDQLLENDMAKLKNKDFVQNTSSLKSHENKYVIKPYECIPGVCIPDQCDPFQCLTLIERRKHKTKNNGTKSIRCRYKSTSSMTSRQRIKMNNKRTESKTLGKIRNSSRKLTLNSKPIRQSVRIASNFSFDVQLFKENSRITRKDDEQLKAGNPYRSTSSIRKIKSIQENKTNHKKTKKHFTQSEKSDFNKSSQIKFVGNVKSTMTNSFIKRCFCVANLRKKQNLRSVVLNKSIKVEGKLRPQKTSSFLERCICVLKSITTVKEIFKKTPNVVSQAVFNDIPRPRKLAPYECEPGICMPEICDPYECNRIIKYRKPLGVEIISNTDKYKITPVSSGVMSLRKVKDKRTQFNKQEEYKSHVQRPPYRSGTNKKRDSKTSGRQMVRIGSNVSLGVEFYKIKGIGKTDTMDSVSTTNYKYIESPKTNINNRINKTQHKGTYIKKSKIYNQEAQEHAIKKNSKASGVSHILKRCFCTLALQKQNFKNISSQVSTRNNKAHESITSYIKNQNFITLDKNVSYIMKPFKGEDSICRSGPCDPNEREKRNRKGLHTEFRTLADTKIRKSALKLIPKHFKKENTKVRSKLKSNKNDVYLKRNRVTALKVPGISANRDNGKPRKQAVKISSNFGFNIEFFKDKKSYDGIWENSKSPKKQYKHVKSNIFNVGSLSTSYKHKGSQDIKTVQNADSQFPTKTVQSTMTRVKPFLKRCFCLLKLQKSKGKSPPITRNTSAVGSDLKEIFDLSPKINTTNKTTFKSNRDTNNAPFMNLKSYECEPGVCKPGKCYPYECIKRIDIRENMIATKISTNQKPTFLSKYSSRGLGAKITKSRALIVEGKNRANLIKKELSTFIDHPLRQRHAAHVSSSLNIEIVKDRKPLKYTDVPKHRKLLAKNENFCESLPKLEMKNMTTGNGAINFRHRQSQVKHARTESKASGMNPLLKRCFCTLKLEKLGKQSKLQPVTVKIKPNAQNTHTESKSVAQTYDLSSKIKAVKSSEPYKCAPNNCTPGFCDTFECERRIKKHRTRVLSKVTSRNKKIKSTKMIKRLKPYECVPGVCTPGFCIPYECQKRIKKRQMRVLSTETERSKLLSTSSLTSRNNKIKSTKSQMGNMKRRHRRHVKNVINKSSKIFKSKITPSLVESSNRQAVSVGSSSSFNIEFYKDRSLKPTRSLPVSQNVKPDKKYKNIDTISKRSRASKTHGSQVKRFSYNRGSQGKVIHMESVGSGAPKKLKRCFCTLALQKSAAIPIPNYLFNTVSKPILKPVEVSTQTKFNLNKPKRYTLEPYECKPGTCIPGECNAKNCFKIMQRNSLRHSQTDGTQQKPSQISVLSSTYPNISKSKTTQADHKFRKQHTLKLKHNQKSLVKEPYSSFAPDLQNRQSVRIGSNFSFTIDFSRKSLPHKVFTDLKYDRKQRSVKYEQNKMKINSKDTKCTSVECNVINSRSHKSQSELLKVKHKASLVGNILKRCFCTAKLYNNYNITRPKTTTINEIPDGTLGQSFNHQQYYVYYQLKKTMKTVCPQKCKCITQNKNFPKFTNTVGTRTKNKYLKFEPNQYITPKNKTGTVDTKSKTCHEMETILPYTPRKFNKKTSKAILTNVTGLKKFNSHKCPTTCICNDDINCIQKSKRRDKKRFSKGFINKKRKSPVIKDSFDKISIPSHLRTGISRCKEKIVKQQYTTNKANLSEYGNQFKPLSHKLKWGKRSSKRDNLKKCNSERRPIDKSRNEPKISKSLKILKKFSENLSQIVNQNKNKIHSRFQQGDTTQNKTIPVVVKLYKAGESNGYKKYIANDYHIKNDKQQPNSKIFKSNKYRNKTVKFSGVSSKSQNKVPKMTILNILTRKLLCKCSADKKKKAEIEIKEQKLNRKVVSPPREQKRKLLGREEYYKYCHVTPLLSKNENWDATNNKIMVTKLNVEDNKRAATRKDNSESKMQEFMEDIKKGKEITFPLVIEDSSQIKEKRKYLRTDKQTIYKSKNIMGSKSLKLHEAGNHVKGVNKVSNISKSKEILTKKAMLSRAINEKKVCECRASMHKDKEAKMLAKRMEGKICKCYPSVCECAKIVKIEKARRKKKKALIKKQLIKDKKEKKRRKRLEKEKKTAGKRRRRDLFLRQKRYKIEDALRLHKRRDLEKYLERRLKLKDTPDYLVATESLLDLAKLSCTVMEDIARSTYRAMIDPHYSCKRVKETVKKPSRIWPLVKTAVVNSGAPATFKRIILRCKNMSSIKKIKARLVKNRCTNYLLHIADRDPRKRLKMKKTHERLKRQRVPLDFQCSLYMASLRKKPFLKVYFKCPWFYPHFLNLLAVLRQLSDMFLFILAAIVWSPCILGMELCRAMMCCFLCTG